MLWAQFQPRNEAEAAGFFIGVMMAGLISGGIPFFVGVAMRQVTLGIAGGIISAGAGALAGCCLGIPVAVLFTIIIVVVAQYAGRERPEPRFPEPIVDDYDDYARPFRVPERERWSDRRRGKTADDKSIPWADECDDRSDGDWRKRVEDEERFRKRGFRPRRRPPNSDPQDGPQS
jgi:hypothetical protein